MTTLLAVSNVSVSFGALRALAEVSLDVPGGGIVGLIGPNGAGKTTLFNVISGLQPAAGSVKFEGRELLGMPAHCRAQMGIGRSFQNLGLMQDETVLTNVLAAQHVNRGYRLWDLAVRPWHWWKAESALAQHAEEIFEDLGLADHADKLVADLSFGVARFVELAAVLVARPRLMLLDEPTTGLGPNETKRLTNLLLNLRAEGTTILVVAHDVRFVMAACDDVYVLAEGRNLAHGIPGEIQRDSRVIETYLGRVA